MKKTLMVMMLLLAAGVSIFATERDWEVIENILEGGCDAGGAYWYKFESSHISPSSLPLRKNWHGTQDFYTDIPIGWGEFKIKSVGEAKVLCPLEGIETSRKATATLADGEGSERVLRFGAVYYGSETPTISLQGSLTTHVYKKYYLQPLTAQFSAEAYTAQIGESVTVTVVVMGGSGRNTGVGGVRPAWLLPVGQYAWSGSSPSVSETPMTVIVRDNITGEEAGDSTTIIITEKSSDDGSGSGSGGGGSGGGGGTPTDPGGGSAGDSGDGGGDSGGGGDPIDVGGGDSDDGNDDDIDTGDTGGGTPIDPGEGMIDVGDGDIPDNDTNDGENTGGTPIDPGGGVVDEIIVIGDGSNADSGSGDNGDDGGDSGDTGNGDEIIVIGDGGGSAGGSGDGGDEIIVIGGDDNSGGGGGGGGDIINIGSGDTIIVTDDSITSAQNRGSNYNIAISIGLIGAGAGLGSTGAAAEMGAAEAEAYQQIQQQGE